MKIAFFLGELQLDTQRKVLDGIVKAANKDGNSVYIYSLTLTADEKFNEGEAGLVINEDFSIYDGFIIYAETIYGSDTRAKVIKKLQQLNKPCACIDFYIPGMINVSSDNESAMAELSKHLVHHHKVKTVNFISGPADSLDAKTRKRVFIDELESTGVKFDERRCFVGDFYARSGRKAVEYFEENGLLEADAYVCANDQMALGAYYALVERGINIPDDTLLSGYDNIFQAANHYPRITSVNRSEEKIGEVAYKNVMKAIMGKPYDMNPVVESNAVFCESCGCELGRPVSHRIVVNQYAKNGLDETRYAEMVSNVSIELTNAQSLEDIYAILKRFVPELGGDAFCFASFDPEEKAEDKTLKIGINYFDGKFGKLTEEKLSTRERIDFNKDKGNFYIISSLHYRDKLHGFTVIRNSRIPLETEFYRIFNINLSNAIEQVENLGKMQKMIKTLDEMWVFDPMTHVYNRAGFFKFADEVAKEAAQNKEDMFFIFLDIDGLKQVNDVHGHEMGDKMICEMADILRKTRNKEDLLMRYGGDEFVVYGKGIKEDEIVAKVDKIRKAMDEVNAKENRRYWIDASIGYHMVPYDNTMPISALIELADQEMYKEKREKHKKNGFH